MWFTFHYVPKHPAVRHLYREHNTVSGGFWAPCTQRSCGGDSAMCVWMKGDLVALTTPCVGGCDDATFWSGGLQCLLSAVRRKQTVDSRRRRVVNLRRTSSVCWQNSICSESSVGTDLPAFPGNGWINCNRREWRAPWLQQKHCGLLSWREEYCQLVAWGAVRWPLYVHAFVWSRRR